MNSSYLEIFNFAKHSREKTLRVFVVSCKAAPCSLPPLDNLDRRRINIFCRLFFTQHTYWKKKKNPKNRFRQKGKRMILIINISRKNRSKKIVDTPRRWKDHSILDILFAESYHSNFFISRVILNWSRNVVQSSKKPKWRMRVLGCYVHLRYTVYVILYRV